MADPRFPAETPGWPQRIGFIDRTGEMVIPQDYQYSGLSEFNAHGFAVVTTLDDREQVVIDASGAIRYRFPPNHISRSHRPPDENGLFPVVHHIDGDNPDLWKIDGRDRVFTGRKAHYAMRLDGSVAFEAEIIEGSNGFYAFTEGSGRDQRYGIIDLTGHVTVPATYKSLFWSQDGHHVARSEDSIVVIDNRGTEIYRVSHELHRITDILRVVENRLVHWDNGRNRCLIANVLTGETIPIPPSEDPSPPGQSPLRAMMNMRLPFIADGALQIKRPDGTTTFLDLDGEPLMRNWARRPVVFKPDIRVGYFREGLATYRKDDLSGYIDKSGTLVIERRFGNALPFRNGLAKVHLSRDDFQEHRLHYIDATGEIVYSNH